MVPSTYKSRTIQLQFPKGVYTHAWQSVKGWNHVLCETKRDKVKQETRIGVIDNKQKKKKIDGQVLISCENKGGSTRRIQHNSQMRQLL